MTRAYLGFLVVGVLVSLPASAGLTTTEVMTGFDRPVFLTAPPGDADRLFVVEKNSGLIRIVTGGAILATPFLDIDSLTVDSGERGLLGMAFHPDYDANGFFYVNYTRAGDGATVVARYTVSADPNVADAGSALILLTVFQPATNHNAGMLAFGPNDGYLYVAMGDGGDGGARSQDLTDPLGGMLRLDVDAVAPYIPPDNPYAGSPTNDKRIWARGLRNPWRFSFDRTTGDMYIGDVGQGTWEEIDYQPASSTGAEDYGWPTAEGFECTGGGGTCGSDSGRTPPIAVHGRSDFRSITGGYVYRGAAIPSLQGTYFYADFILNNLYSLEVVGGSATNVTDRTVELQPGGAAIGSIASFGEDALGEVYVVDYGNGRILKIVSDDPDTDGDGISDVVETGVYGTNPNLADSDGDGHDDLVELAFGSDPNTPGSTPFSLPAASWLSMMALALVLLGAAMASLRTRRMLPR